MINKAKENSKINTIRLVFWPNATTRRTYTAITGASITRTTRTMQRLFTSGSRQAPDPYDQFLEQHNFYRKHTARDSSCLFRVISEQMYDTQRHHLDIRKKCVRYMRKHRSFFNTLVDRDFEEYLDDMSKPKTHGSLVELQALAYLYERKVILFEPYNLGNFLCAPRSYSYEFRVFYSPERHFDSVFTCDYIKDAAICQSICYEILYKDLFKLPDVNYAVEKMLHADVAEGQFEYNEYDYAVRVYMEDGRIFYLDMPEQTNCILENYKLCHFHYANFPYFSNELQPESLLPDKFVSCVRQLLREGITPFPYKVAKALDPNMYRNIEFDAWNEARKELRMQNWYNGDNNFKLLKIRQRRVHAIFQVGAKCHVKLPKCGNDLYTCHIQEISVDKGCCLVFIEQLGEKRMVPYESLSPLPPEQFKPWSLPYRLQRHSMRLTRHYNYHFKLNAQYAATAHELCGPPTAAIKADNWHDFPGAGVVAEHGIIGGKPQHYHHHAAYNTAAAALSHKANCFYKLKQFTHLDNFHPPTIELCAMPITVENDSATNDAQLTINGTQQDETVNAPASESNGAAVSASATTIVTTVAVVNSTTSITATTATATTATVVTTAVPVISKSTDTPDRTGNTPITTVTVNPTALGQDDFLANGMEQLVIDPSMSMSVGMPPTGAYIPELGYCYYQPYPPNYYANALDDYYGMSSALGASGGFAYDYPVTGGTVYYMYPHQSAGASYQMPPSSTMYFSGSAPMQHTPTAVAAVQAVPAPSPLFNTPTNNGAVGAMPVPMHTFGSTPIACNNAACYTAATPTAPYNSIAGATALITPNPPAVACSQHYTPAAYNSPAMARGRAASGGAASGGGGGGGIIATHHQSCMSITPVNGRINWDAKKSVKSNGVDLPTDMATLRYFYNLGLDYHKQLQRKESQHGDNANSDFVKLDENANQHDHKADANNNNAPNLNNQISPTGAGGNNYNPNSNYNKNHYTRRFNARYSSGKDRAGGASNPRYGGGANNMATQHSVGSAAFGSHGMLARGQQNHDYNNNTAKGGGNYSHKSGGGGGGNYNSGGGATPNTSRHPSIHGGNQNAGGNASGGRNSLMHGHNDHMPIASPSAGAGGEPNSQPQQPNPYTTAQQHGGQYEQVGDGPRGLNAGPGAGAGSAVLAPQAGTAGVHVSPAMQVGGGGNGLFMPMAPPPYGAGIFTNAPPPNLAGAGAYQQPPPPYGTVPPPSAQFQQLPPPAGGLLAPPPLHGAAAAAFYAQSNGGSDTSENCGGGILSMTNTEQQHFTRMSYPPPPLPPQNVGQSNAAMSYYYAPAHGSNMPMANPPNQFYWNAPHASTSATQHAGNTAAAAAQTAGSNQNNNNINEYTNAAGNNRTFGQQTDNTNTTANAAANNTNNANAGAAANTANNNTAGGNNNAGSASNIVIAKRNKNNNN